MREFELKHKTYHCLLCASAYSAYSKRRLDEHMKYHHSKDIKCSLCDHAFYFEEELKIHAARHSGRNGEKEFSSPQNLALQKAKKKCDTMICPHCPRMMTKSKLKKHLLTHGDSLYCRRCTKYFESQEKNHSVSWVSNAGIVNCFFPTTITDLHMSSWFTISMYKFVVFVVKSVKECMVWRNT